MTIMPVAEFMPDMPDLAEATTIAQNVIALTPASYGPMRDLYPFSNAIVVNDHQILGMGAAAAVDLTQYFFTGVNKSLYMIPGGSTSFSNVSGATYAAYPENWRFAQFKQLMLATDFNDPIQSYTMGSGGVFGNLSATAPRARHIAVAKNFVIVGNTSDPVGGDNPARMWWSAYNDPTNWPTPGSVTAQQTQSDYNDMNGPMGAITGLAPNLAGCDCAVFFERGVFRMIYAGPPDVFDFYPAASVRGTTASNSVVSLGQIVYYLGEDGFYAFDGNTSVPIGANKVDKWFLANADLTTNTYGGAPSLTPWNNDKLVIGAADVNNKAIIWLFRLLSDPLPSYGFPAPTTMLIYRWDIQRWSIASLPTQWICRVPSPATTTPSTLAPVSISQGHLQLAAMSPLQAGTNNSYLSYFNGAFLTAQVGSKVVQIVPDSRAMLTGVRPLVNSGQQSDLATEAGDTLVTEAGDAIGTEDYSVAITVAVSARATYQDAEVFGADTPLDIIGNASFRADGRYHRARITVDAHTTGIWSQLAGFDVAASKSGQR